MTGAGRLMCKHIIHLKARTSEKGWVESLTKCLEAIEMLGHNSVSFPALGTGEKKVFIVSFSVFEEKLIYFDKISSVSISST